MMLLDANVLIHAYAPTSPLHSTVRVWLEDTLASDEAVAIPWQSIWAFIRITSNARLLEVATSVEVAMATMESLLELPNVMTLNPGEHHWMTLKRLAFETPRAGSPFSDTVLAALAIEHQAVLVSTDQDFAKYPDLQWLNPA